jgi:hypothetical protein
MYNCEKCNYETDDKSKWERHIKTKKHTTIDLIKNDKLQLEKEKMEYKRIQLELQKDKLELQKNKMEQKRIKEEEEKEQKRIKEETKRIKEEKKNNSINWDDLVYDNIKSDISFNFKSMVLYKNSYFFEELLIAILKNPKLRCMRFKDNDLEIFNEEWKTHMIPDDDDLKYDINDVLERLKEIGSEFSDAIKHKHHYGLACNGSITPNIRLKTLIQIIKNASVGFDFFYEQVKEKEEKYQEKILKERETLEEKV